MATESASFTCKSEQRPCSVTAPRVSVVMGAYNGERFLRPAIESILNQTFRDFELIVIDDCSTDATPRILREFKDDRMRVVRNERNLGIAKTLNKGIAIARGEYVALQDHDDLSQPDRFSKQVAFLETHPRVGMVGSRVNLIDESGVALSCGPALREYRHQVAVALGQYPSALPQHPPAYQPDDPSGGHGDSWWVLGGSHIPLLRGLRVHLKDRAPLRPGEH